MSGQRAAVSDGESVRLVLHRRCKPPRRRTCAGGGTGDATVGACPSRRSCCSLPDAAVRAAGR